MPKLKKNIKFILKTIFFNLILKYDKKNIFSKIFFKKNIFQRGLAKYLLKYQDLQYDIFLSNCLNVPGKEFEILNKEPSKNFVNKLNSVAGYVPFEQGKTSVSLYNFFSKNYSIRKQLLGVMYYLKDGLLLYSEWFLLPTDCAKVLDLTNKNIDADTIAVEYFHSRIPKNHANHSGHLRFHGIYDNYSATVHSMPIENYYAKHIKVISNRKYFPKNTQDHNLIYNIGVSNFFNGKKLFNVKDKDLYGNYSKKIKTYLGYNLIYSKYNNYDDAKTEIRSVFHDSTFTNLDHKPAFNFQLIDIPKIEGINAIIYFTETFLIETSIKLKLYFFGYDQKIFYIKEVEVNYNSQISIKDMVDIDLSSLKFVIVEICEEGKTNQYINVYYTINNKICDNVHTHCLEDLRCLPDKNLKVKLGSQALKWMHFPEQENYSSFISIINSEYELDFKLRVIFSDQDEFIIQKNEIENILSIGKIDIDFRKLLIKKKLPLNKEGIVQLECRNSNPNANLFSYHALNKTLCVDHFTGG